MGCNDFSSYVKVVVIVLLSVVLPTLNNLCTILKDEQL